MAPTVAKLYCSNPCRRTYQDERRKAERHDAKEQRRRLSFREFVDPWEAPEECFSANALLDGWA